MIGLQQRLALHVHLDRCTQGFHGKLDVQRGLLADLNLYLLHLRPKARSRCGEIVVSRLEERESIGALLVRC